MNEILAYEAHGWKLCAIEPGKKAPTYPGWNTTPMPAESIVVLDNGVGLLHVLSGTCVLDIDDISLARPWLAEQGVDLDALLDEPAAVQITSGRVNRAKLVYALKKPLRTLKPTGSGLELRCATAEGKSVQDVLPPSVHPLTKKPYAWKYGDELIAHWSTPPGIPAKLYKLWKELAADIPEVSVAAPVVDATIRIIQKAIDQYIKSKKRDVDSYSDWIDIGMRLHQQTSGSMEGFALWDEWSRTGKKYRGIQDLRDHWMSFTSKGSGPKVSMAQALSELPAQPEEFPDATHEKPDTQNTEILLKVAAKEKRQKAVGWLEKRLFYVRNVERYFDTLHHQIYATEHAIEHMYTSEMPMGKGGKRVNPVTLLKESGTKIIVDELGFHPAEGTTYKFNGMVFANQYRDTLPEPTEPTGPELERIEWLFDRIDDTFYRHWLMQLYAYVIQHPGKKIRSAPLIWSKTQGNGKTTILRVIPSLLVGPEYSKEVNRKLLETGFNDYLLKAWHINLTEFRGDTRSERESYSKMVETWIADDAIAISPKHRTGFTMPNHLFLTASSNYEDAASITNEDRKWGIHEMHAKQMTESEQKWLYAYLRSDRAAATLRHYFLKINTDSFVASAAAPETEARREMIQAGVAMDDEWLRVLWEQREGPFQRDVVQSHEVQQYVAKRSVAKPTMQRIGRMLAQPPYNGESFKFRAGSRTYRAIALFNKHIWLKTSGLNVLDHINGSDVQLQDDSLLN